VAAVERHQLTADALDLELRTPPARTLRTHWCCTIPFVYGALRRNDFHLCSMGSAPQGSSAARWGAAAGADHALVDVHRREVVLRAHLRAPARPCP
jgi:hypothetical protein